MIAPWGGAWVARGFLWRRAHRTRKSLGNDERTTETYEYPFYIREFLDGIMRLYLSHQRVRHLR